MGGYLEIYIILTALYHDNNCVIGFGSDGDNETKDNVQLS